MKKFSKLFISLLAAGSLASCSSDNIDGPSTPQIGENDGVNMKISIALPASSGTRAPGDPIGEEDGKSWENNVSKVLVLLTGDDDELIASTTTDITEADYSDSGDKFTSISTFNASVLVNYIDGLGSDVDQAPVRVYIYCNPSQTLVDAVASQVGTTAWRNQICKIQDSDKLGRNGNKLKFETTKDIPMANEKVAKFNLPNKSAILSGAYADKNKAFSMGEVSVIRSIARFDYKAKNNNNEYSIKVTTGDTNSDKGSLTIKLTHMALVNMSNGFYYLHRVSTENSGANPVYCGEDKRESYLVDSDWEWKASKTWTASMDYSKNFMYPLYADGKQNVKAWNSIDLSELSEDDIDNPWNGENNESYQGYKIWRYVTENTIPGDESNQKNGISTGVVFRGKLIAAEDTPEALKNVLNGTEHKPIFVYNGIIYASWNEVKKDAEKEEKAGTDLKAAYDKCKVESGEPTAEAAKNAGFTVYSYDEGAEGYATLYYYWNRHWDNGELGKMGPMEFAVVRNNVYKLCVEDISGLGRPRNPGDDPDPVDPNDPDEKNDVNIKLSCQIKKWTVRANGIHL